MSKTKALLEEAKDTLRKSKEIVLELLNEPMTENQKELVLALYRLIK